MFRKRAREEEYRVLLIQYRELLEKLQRENSELREALEDARRRIEAMLKLFFPDLYAKRRDRSLDEAIRLLADGLDSWRRELQERERALTRLKALKETCIEVPDLEKVRDKLRQLNEAEIEALKLALMGYCTTRSLSEEMGIAWKEAESILEDLCGRGFLEVLRVKTGRSSRGIPVFFPSPYGEAASKVLLSKPWNLVHAEVLKDKGMYVGNSELIRRAEVRLRQSGYKVVTEFDDPSECSFQYSKGVHRADLAVYVNSQKRQVMKILVECESMSNPVSQVSKMLDAYYEKFRRIFIVVGSRLARRMMVQRACYWAWRKGELVMELRVESIDRLNRLESMPKYVLTRLTSRIFKN